MNVFIFLLILIIGFSLINRNYNLENILNKYKKNKIIKNVIGEDIIERVKNTIKEIYNGNNEYKVYNYEILEYLIEKINEDINNYNMIGENKILYELKEDIMYIKKKCKNDINKNISININKYYIN